MPELRVEEDTLAAELGMDSDEELDTGRRTVDAYMKVSHWPSSRLVHGLIFQFPHCSNCCFVTSNLSMTPFGLIAMTTLEKLYLID